MSFFFYLLSVYKMRMLVRPVLITRLSSPPSFPPSQILKYLKRWSTTILPAGVLTYSTVKWADWEFDQIHREHWD